MKQIIRKLSVGLVVSLAAAGTLSAQNGVKMQQLAQANNRFAIDIFRKVSPQATENVFLSPYSLSSALTMTRTGARGETYMQMTKALHLWELPADAVPRDFFIELRGALADAQTYCGAQLSIANSLWPEQNPEHPFLQDFMTSVEKDFGAGLFPVDYRNHSEEARLKINQWVEDKTQQRIKNLLHTNDVSPATRLALINAIYFKGQWAAPFDERRTTDQPFHLADGSSKSVKLMNNPFQFYDVRYADITTGPVHCQLLSLDYTSNTFGPRRGGDTYGGPPAGRGGPFGGGPGISMLVVLPRVAGDLGALEKALTAEQLAAWVEGMRPAWLRVFLPKFRLEARYDQLPVQLKEMGVVNAFKDPRQPNGADFSGMNGATNLYISKVIHQTFVAVDEKGTEAAAATAVLMRDAGMPPASPPEFRADHPFLFFIRENSTGSILFMGRLANPPDARTASAK